ncbi:MAG: amino acid permease [Gemmataceae bacterium]|nr:amino acid permease [Gemmataceae bacterium]
MSSPANGSEPAKPRLGLFDAASIIVGIVIGSTIFLTPPEIFHSVGNHWVVLGMWAFAGLLAFIGALCYAELATAYPRLGGDYNYLTRAYGPLPGYLFAWAQLAVVQTASVGMMASIFAEYTGNLARTTGWWSLDEYTFLEVIDFPPEIAYAVGAVIFLTLLNLLGVVLGKTAQNLLSVLKILGLLAIIVAGFAFARWPAPEEQPNVLVGTVGATADDHVMVSEQESGQTRTFVVGDRTRVTIDRRDVHPNLDPQTQKPTATVKQALEKLKEKRKDLLKDGRPLTVKVFTRQGAGATEPVLQIKTVNVFDWANIFALMAGPMILIMLAYGGWNDAAFVAAEVRDRDRNLPRALLWGIAIIALIYVLVNGAYVFGLGAERVDESAQVAADTLALLPEEVGTYGQIIMSILVMIAALGAVNGLIYTSSRIYATLGADYSLFAPLGKWSRGLGTPVWSLLLQMLITLSMLVMVGTTQGQGWLNDGLTWLGFQPVTEWHIGGFFPLLKCSAPIFWLFFLMAGLALFTLRINEPHVERPFRVPLFPIVPLLFCATCGYMLWSGIRFAGQLGVVGALLVLVGLPFYILARRSNLAADRDDPGERLARRENQF